MKRIIILLLATILSLVLLAGCNTDTASVLNQSSQEEQETGGDDWDFCQHQDLGGHWMHDIHGAFINYVGDRDFYEKYYNPIMEKVKQVGNSAFEELSIFTLFEFFEFTPDESLTIINDLNNQRIMSGGQAIYSEEQIKIILEVVYGDPNIKLTKSVPTSVPQYGQTAQGLLFGVDSIESMAKTGASPENSIPLGIIYDVGIRNYHKWVAGLESRDQYTVVKFILDFKITPEEYTKAVVETMQFDKETIYTREVFDRVCIAAYGKTQSLPDVKNEYKEPSSEPVESSYPWNTPEEKSAYYASSEAMMAQNQPQSTVTQQSPVTSQ